MAFCAEISFGNSDEELDGEDSDIDFEGFEVDRDEESEDNETGNKENDEGTSDVEAKEEETWTVELSNFEVNEFVGEPGLQEDAKADEYCSERKLLQ